MNQQMAWLYLRARRIRLQLVALASVGIIEICVGRVAFKLPSFVGQNAAAVPVAYLLPLVSAVALGQAVRSDARVFEETGFRQLRLARALHAMVFLALSVLTCTAIGGQTSFAAMRNCIGFGGLVLLTAVLVGAEMSWLFVTPYAIVAPGLARVSSGTYAPWAWFLRPVSVDTMLFAASAGTLGLLTYTLRNCRRSPQTELAGH